MPHASASTPASRRSAMRCTAWMSVGAVAILLTGTAAAQQLYRCTTKGGTVEYRDYPCSSDIRPPTLGQPSTRDRQGATGSASGSPLDSSLRRLGFDGVAGYERARRNCMAILSQTNTAALGSNCAPNDSACYQRAADLLARQMAATASSAPWKSNKCDEVAQLEQRPTTRSPEGDEFEVVAVNSSCKYFVAEQGASFALVDRWACPRPRRGDSGRGDLGGPGSKDVSIEGTACTAYVDAWLMGKTRALERLIQKCH
jgi:hypothetical protein